MINKISEISKDRFLTSSIFFFPEEYLLSLRNAYKIVLKNFKAWSQFIRKKLPF